MNTINIRSLDMDARGVGHLENEDGSQGKVVFVEGALPGEVVGFNPYKKKASWEAATLGPIVKESSQRIKPKCPHFGVCGGCSMQHLEPNAQVAMKQIVKAASARVMEIEAELKANRPAMAASLVNEDLQLLKDLR